MAAGWNKRRRRVMSAETRQRLSLLRKGVKRTEEDKLRIRLGQQTVPRIKCA